jgi:hypothetical protein
MRAYLLSASGQLSSRRLYWPGAMDGVYAVNGPVLADLVLSKVTAFFDWLHRHRALPDGVLPAGRIWPRLQQQVRRGAGYRGALTAGLATLAPGHA